MLFAALGMALYACGAAASPAQPADERFFLGTWAQHASACRHPELIFSGQGLEIAIDADGEPAAFYYANVEYQATPGQVLVRLKSPHPYAQTMEKEALQFRRIGRDAIALRRSKGNDTRFVRCTRRPQETSHEYRTIEPALHAARTDQDR
jgi:hypothetical protein